MLRISTVVITLTLLGPADSLGARQAADLPAEHAKFVTLATSFSEQGREKALEQLAELPENDNTLVPALLAALNGEPLPEERAPGADPITARLRYIIATRLVVIGADALDQMLKDLQENVPRKQLVAARALGLCTEIEHPPTIVPAGFLDLRRVRQAHPGRELLDQAMIQKKLPSLRKASETLARALEKGANAVQGRIDAVSPEEIAQLEDVTIANYELARAIASVAPDKETVLGMVKSLKAFNTLRFEARKFRPREADTSRETHKDNAALVRQTLGSIEATPDLVRSLLKQPGWEGDELLAVSLLGMRETGSRLPADVLARLHEFALRGPDDLARSYALSAVYRWDTKKSLVSLCRRLIEDPRWGLRRDALNYLCEADPALAEAVPSIVDRLEDKKEVKEVRLVAVKALAKAGVVTDATLRALEKTLRDRDSELRWKAASAIDQFGPRAKSALPALIDTLQDKEDKVAEAVEKAVLAVGPTAETVPKLTRYVQQPRPELCGRAARILQVIGPSAKAALDPLSHAYSQHKDRPELQSAVRQAVLSIGEATDPRVQIVAEGVFAEDSPNLDKEQTEAILRALEQRPDSVSLLIKAVRKSKDMKLRRGAVVRLEKLGPKAVAAVEPLGEVLLGDKDTDLCVAVAHALGEIGCDTGVSVPQLTRVFDQKERNLNVCAAAVEAIGRMGPHAKAAIPFLIRTLDLGLGPGPGGFAAGVVMDAAEKALLAVDGEALAALESGLNDPGLMEQRPRIAHTLGRFKAQARTALPALTRVLKENQSPAVRSSIGKAIRSIAEDLEDIKAQLSHAEVQTAHDNLEEAVGVMESLVPDLPDDPPLRLQIAFREDLAQVKRAVDHLKPVEPSAPFWQSPVGLALLGLFGAIVVVPPLLLWAVPLWRLPFESFLPAWFVYSVRVQDHWITRTARELKLELLPTMRQHPHYVPVPAVVAPRDMSLPRLEVKDLRPQMQEKPSCWLLCGDGGVGKTSLACALVRAGLAADPRERLRRHLMLPLFIESQLGAQVSASAKPFLAAVRGALRALVGEEPSDDFLRCLLLDQRILVVVDQYSELPETARALLRPGDDGFPANALLITSRFDEELGNVARHVVRMGALPAGVLKTFMLEYLQRQQPGASPRVLDGAAERLCRMSGNRAPTALMATMYVDVLSAHEDEVQNVPELIVAFVRQRCRQAGLDLEGVLRDARSVAWECLRDSFRPGTARGDDVLRALSEPEAPARLERLKRPDLALVQDMAGTAIRFTLDAVAEYLAALHLVSTIANNRKRWLELLAAADKQPGGSQTIRGFWRALLDCCSAAGIGDHVPPSIKQEVAARVGADATDIVVVPAPRPDGVPAHDLDIRVRLSKQRDRLEYELSSPNGSLPYNNQPMGERDLPAPADIEEYVAGLRKELELQATNRDAGGKPLAPERAQDRLEALGRRLYGDLFSEEMKTAYSLWRGLARTVLITSDEPWIPWELIRPYENRPQRPSFEDGFLCETFRLTRWLKGETVPARRITVSRLACLAVDAPPGEQALNCTDRERRALADLAREQGLEDRSSSPSTLAAFEGLRQAADIGLWHFAGHGNFDPKAPADALIQLSDAPLQASALTGEKSAAIRKARPLVFFNACRTGQLGWSLAQVRGWAETWVKECHCGAFVGPLWSVDDELACQFALTFYQALRAGKTIGAAAELARLRLRNTARGNPAWLAYSVYALPNARVQFGPAAPVQPPGITPDEIFRRANEYQQDAGRWLTDGGLDAASERLAAGRSLVAEGLEREPDNSLLLVTSGYIEKTQAQLWELRGDYESAAELMAHAEEAFRRAAKADVMNLSAYNGLANCLAYRGDREGAIEIGRLIYKMAPNYAPAALDLALSLDQKIQEGSARPDEIQEFIKLCHHLEELILQQSRYFSPHHLDWVRRKLRDIL